MHQMSFFPSIFGNILIFFNPTAFHAQGCANSDSFLTLLASLSSLNTSELMDSGCEEGICGIGCFRIAMSALAALSGQ